MALSRDPRARPLAESDVDPDPVRQFNVWLEEARAAGAPLPEAMTLATADASGRPSARMLLLKSAGPHGFTFFTGYESRKGRELNENPRAAIVVYWHALGRQVRVEGPVRRLAPEESDAYFDTRPPSSRAAAAASRQSEPLESRGRLEAEFERLLAEHGDSVRRPPHWGGYVLEPETIELWQHREDRLHDRLLYTREGRSWRLERLSP
jgi:pyridoxamine 5'-phosphate oxidase